MEKGADTDSDEREGDFGSFVTMTLVDHRTETSGNPRTATPTTSQRKLRAPKGKQQIAVEHAHIPNLPPPEKSKTGPRKKGQEGGVGGVDCASSSEESIGEDKNKTMMIRKKRRRKTSR